MAYNTNEIKLIGLEKLMVLRMSFILIKLHYHKIYFTIKSFQCKHFSFHPISHFYFRLFEKFTIMIVVFVAILFDLLQHPHTNQMLLLLLYEGKRINKKVFTRHPWMNCYICSITIEKREFHPSTLATKYQIEILLSLLILVWFHKCYHVPFKYSHMELFEQLEKIV